MGAGASTAGADGEAYKIPDDILAQKKELIDACPVSPLEEYLTLASSGRQLRTGYAHLYQFLPNVDRSAASEFRMKCRSEEHTGQTSGFAPGFVQANFVALPKLNAFDFLSFALQNPKACPLLAVTQPGDPCPKIVAPDADLRTDIPKYRVWRDGLLDKEVNNITDLWDENMVGFLLGCSFSWENVLKEAGLCPRQIEEGKNVPMFKTNISNSQVGPFQGNLVVSMRPYTVENIPKAADLTGCYPGAHGGPVHWGDPTAIGFSPDDLLKPHWGDAVEIKEGEVPCFWACGVTPQTAIEGAKLPLAITHAPGHMFIADIQDHELKVVNIQSSDQNVSRARRASLF